MQPSLHNKGMIPPEPNDPARLSPLPYADEELADWPRDQLGRMEPARMAATSALSVARFLDRLEINQRRKVLRKLPASQAAAILSEMDEEAAAETLAEMRLPRAASILDDVEPDDAADILANLDESDRERLLDRMESSARRTLEQLMAYEPETAGGIMTTEVDTALDSMSVHQAIDRIRQLAHKHHDLHYLYVVDQFRHLRGIVPLRKLLLAAQDRPVRDIMTTDLRGIVGPETDQEQVALLMAEFNLPDLAVVDRDNKLLGVITHDDVLDVLSEEATEDIQKLAGAGGTETLYDRVTASVRQRQPWLVVNLATAFIAASVVNLFKDEIGALPLLAAIMPIVAGVGGNSGQQSLAITIRSMALGEFRPSEAFPVLLRQAAIGLCNGMAVGLLAALLILLFGGPWLLSLIVFLAMLGNLALGCLAGTFIPIVLQRLDRDPAQVSSVFLTFFTDTGGFFLFLTLGAWLL